MINVLTTNESHFKNIDMKANIHKSKITKSQFEWYSNNSSDLEFVQNIYCSQRQMAVIALRNEIKNKSMRIEFLTKFKVQFWR